LLAESSPSRLSLLLYTQSHPSHQQKKKKKKKLLAKQQQLKMMLRAPQAQAATTFLIRHSPSPDRVVSQAAKGSSITKLLAVTVGVS
jgi:hypothetical protein